MISAGTQVFWTIGALSALSFPAVALRAADAPLVLEAKIPIQHVVGGINHLAIDVGRRRLLVAEQENKAVDVIERDPRRLHHIGSIQTKVGARTSLLVPALGRFYLAVPASSDSTAAIDVYRFSD
jgi:hypothetical protein